VRLASLPWFATSVYLSVVGTGQIATPAIAEVADGSASAIDRQFVCPEALPDDQARSDALKSFMDNMSKAAPDEGIVDVLNYRKVLLQKHGCAKTLGNLQASQDAVLKGAVLEQTWFPVLNNPNFSLSVSASYLKPYLDPRYPNARAVDAYAKVTFAANQQTNVTHHTYDAVVSRSVYYCDNKQYALVENDYFLSGAEVFKDPSAASVVASTNVYDLVPTPPASLNEIAARWACQALKGHLPT
jgi:hypothetical protein